jgi:hypothetical protein
MSWPDHTEGAPSTDGTDGASDRAPNGQQALFHGDTGELPLDTRRALVQLLAGPALDGHRHGRLWTVLLRDEVVIRRQLSELFLDLVIDRDQQVAFTRQADAGELEVPILLRRAPLTFIDSVVLLYLRQRLTQADAQGERAVVSVEEIHEQLTVYRRAASTDAAGLTKRVTASIEKIKRYSILQRIRASSERYEISPTLKLLFSAEEIQALTRQYQRMAADDASADAAVQGTEEESDDQ